MSRDSYDEMVDEDTNEQDYDDRVEEETDEARARRDRAHELGLDGLDGEDWWER